ncbi:Crp/Fnr family transcriptional regulator [Variovorax rhizosphaerae]|uniref:Crp/Fnr family transcriptional regulator n=1 Tax=Variovorax rhizosphaerae TaxID=1836200 RepID=A0ABU8WFS3_9BURK
MTTVRKGPDAYWPLARSLLMREPGFDRCGADSIDALMESARLVSVTRGTRVHQYDVPLEDLIMVVDGVLEVGRRLGAGRRHLVAFTYPGMVLGFLPCVDGGPIPHEAVAHVASVLLLMPVDAVRKRRQIDVSIRQAFEIQFADRIRRLYDSLTESLMLPMHQRLAKLLDTLVGSHGRQSGLEWHIDLDTPQSDLADLLGATRQSVNEALRRLEREGLVRVARSRITVLDLVALRARGPRGEVESIDRAAGPDPVADTVPQAPAER